MPHLASDALPPEDFVATAPSMGIVLLEREQAANPVGNGGLSEERYDAEHLAFGEAHGRPSAPPHLGSTLNRLGDPQALAQERAWYPVDPPES